MKTLKILTILAVITSFAASTKASDISVTLSSPGTLEEEIAKQTNWRDVTGLKVSGHINGDDIYFIRQMAQGKTQYFNYEAELTNSEYMNDLASEGKLVRLDLSDASIDEGGRVYATAISTKDDGTEMQISFSCISKNTISTSMFSSTILESIIFPSNAETMETDKFRVFYGTYNYRNELKYSYETKYAYFPESLKEIDLQNIETISHSAFRNCKLLANIIMDNVKIINHSAFAYCESLSLQSLPPNLKAVYSDAFLNCKSISLRSLPLTLTTIESDAFYGCICPEIKSLTFYDNIRIRDDAMPSLPNLETITFINNDDGDHQVGIGTNAFKGCQKLTSVSFPEQTKMIKLREGVFNDCTSLSTFSTPVKDISLYYYKCFYNCPNLTTMAIGTTIDLDGGYYREHISPFDENNNITELIITKEFDDYDFLYMIVWNELYIPKLKKFTVIENDNGYYSDERGILYKNNLLHRVPPAYSGTFSILETDHDMYPGSCDYCNNITKIYIADPDVSETTIYGKHSTEHWLSKDTYSLLPIFRRNVPEIGLTDDSKYLSLKDGILYNKGQTHIVWNMNEIPDTYTIPDGVTQLNCYAYRGTHYNLRSLTIPASMTNILDYNFNECPNLELIKIGNPIPPSVGYALSESKYTATVIVPAGSEEAYRQHKFWGDYKIVGEESGVTDTESNQIKITVVNGRIVIENSDIDNLKIFDTTGQCLYTGDINSTPALEHGLYIIQIDTGYIQKIAVN